MLLEGANWENAEYLIARGYNRISKYCEAQHLPNETSNIRVGTIQYFRKMEEVQKRDEQEGFLTWRLNVGQMRSVSWDWLNDTTLGFFGHFIPRVNHSINEFHLNNQVGPQDISYEQVPGEMALVIEAMNVDHFGTDFRMHGSIRIDYRSHNCLVFCMSMSDENSISPFGKSDAEWTISIGHRRLFARDLARGIASSVSAADLFYPSYFKLSDITQDHIRSISIYRKGDNFIPDGLSLMYSDGPVEYHDRVLNVTREEDLSPPRFKDYLFSSPFIKHTRFQVEREYRFCFRFFMAERGRIAGVSFNRDHLYVPFDSINGLPEIRIRGE